MASLLASFFILNFLSLSCFSSFSSRHLVCVLEDCKAIARNKKMWKEKVLDNLINEKAEDYFQREENEPEEYPLDQGAPGGDSNGNGGGPECKKEGEDGDDWEKPEDTTSEDKKPAKEDSNSGSKSADKPPAKGQTPTKRPTETYREREAKKYVMACALEVMRSRTPMLE